MMLAERDRYEPQRPSNEEFIADPTRSHIRMLRAKAEELRSVAARTKDDNTRRLLSNAAANYDRFADEAEKLEARLRPKRGDLG